MQNQARKHLSGISGFCLCAMLLGCGKGNSDHTDDNLELRRGIGSEPETLDPGKANDEFSFEVVRDLYEGLTTESSDGSVRPGVAESWKVSPSGKRYTFKIRHSARWSNGQRITSTQFVTSWRRVVNPMSSSPVADTLRSVVGADDIIQGKAPPETLGVSAPEDDVLIVDLVEPTPYFPQILTHSATFPTFSANAASTHKANSWVSNGAYVLNDWVPGATLRLTKNPNYWARETVRISRVAYIPVADDSAELRQYEAGQLDITHSVPNGDFAELQKKLPLELHIAPFLGTAYYALNLISSFPLKDKNLRQALAMAIDRDALQRTILVFGQKAAYSFVPPGTINFEPQSWPWKTLSAKERIAEARRLYQATRNSSTKPLQLKLLFNSSPNIKKLAIAISAMWKETLGIECELIDEEYRVFLNSRKNTSRWDVIRLGWTADYNDATDFLDTFRHFSSNNDSGFNNALFDELLSQASSTMDPTQREKLLQKAESIMLNDYPIIPIYFYSSKRLVKTYVKGAINNPLNRLLSKNLYFDRV